MGLRLYLVPEWPRLYRLQRCVVPYMSYLHYSHFIFFPANTCSSSELFRGKRKTSDATLFIDIQSAKIGDQSLPVGFFLETGVIQHSILCKIPFPILSGNSVTPQKSSRPLFEKACAKTRGSGNDPFCDVSWVTGNTSRRVLIPPSGTASQLPCFISPSTLKHSARTGR